MKKKKQIKTIFISTKDITNPKKALTHIKAKIDAMKIDKKTKNEIYEDVNNQILK